MDPFELLTSLGARVSPDLDAYASGEISASQIRCVLCGSAPCACRPCPSCSWTGAPGKPCQACG
jgi:hypothetical protein